jgi:hypothetical protein
MPARSTAALRAAVWRERHHKHEVSSCPKSKGLERECCLRKYRYSKSLPVESRSSAGVSLKLPRLALPTVLGERDALPRLLTQTSGPESAPRTDRRAYGGEDHNIIILERRPRRGAEGNGGIVARRVWANQRISASNHTQSTSPGVTKEKEKHKNAHMRAIDAAITGLPPSPYPPRGLVYEERGGRQPC